MWAIGGCATESCLSCSCSGEGERWLLFVGGEIVYEYGRRGKRDDIFRGMMIVSMVLWCRGFWFWGVGVALRPSVSDRLDRRRGMDRFSYDFERSFGDGDGDGDGCDGPDVAVVIWQRRLIRG